MALDMGDNAHGATAKQLATPVPSVTLMTSQFEVKTTLLDESPIRHEAISTPKSAHSMSKQQN